MVKVKCNFVFKLVLVAWDGVYVFSDTLCTPAVEEREGEGRGAVGG